MKAKKPSRRKPAVTKRATWMLYREWMAFPMSGEMARVTLVSVAWRAMLMVLFFAGLLSRSEPRMTVIVPAVKKPVASCMRVFWKSVLDRA